MYQLTKDKATNQPTNTVIRLSDNTAIPFNNENTDYQKYLEWITQGNTPLPAEE